jgi:hypothetical protein
MMRVGSRRTAPRSRAQRGPLFRKNSCGAQPARTASRETEFCAQRLSSKWEARRARRPSNCLGGLDFVPPTCGIVGPFQARGRLASPGRLAGGGRSRRKPVSGREIPVNREKNGNFFHYLIFEPPRRRIRAALSMDWTCFAHDDNREFLTSKTGIFWG